MKSSRPAVRWRWRRLLVATIVIWLPVILLTIAILVSSIADCRLDEGSAHPCVILGVDLGNLLYSFAVSGWLMLVTLPFMALTVLIWLARALFLVARRVRALGKQGR
ncbi:hypothetical protein ACLBX9_28355 [Methylobacterium sp. A49B]